jgi:hypothetical protein
MAGLYDEPPEARRELTGLAAVLQQAGGEVAPAARSKTGQAKRLPFFACAEHDRQLGGESPLSSLMVAKD